MKHSSLGIICDRNIKTQALQVIQQQKMVTKHNFEELYAFFCGRELGPLADNWATSEASNFVIIQKKTALSSR